MSTTKTLSLVGFLLFTSILLRSLNVNAATHACLSDLGGHYYPGKYDTVSWSHNEYSCSGDLMRWRYSPTDDVEGDCINWCWEFQDSDGVGCAQMNEDETHKIYCACYQGC
ncbi:hypothetical protein MKW92_003096 [Papaver armeniacum]|nr:hypothetical protein MKW92_003096 [Papaver armeniacum]